MPEYKKLTNEKKEQIVNAVLRIYPHTPYHEISISHIANELRLSEVDLNKDVETKEEAFLLVILKDLSEWINDVEITFNLDQELNPEEFATQWISTISKHKRLLDLLSLVHKIEQNVSDISLSDYKQYFYQEYERLFQIIPKVLPWLKREKLQNFLRTQFYYSVGLNPSTRINDTQKEGKYSNDISLFEKSLLSIL